MEIDVIKSKELSKPCDDRYVIINRKTKKVIDDAQDYGYKSKKNTYRAYTFKF